MPEMAGLCGTRFQIWKSAHKTCDPTGATDLRRMKDAVHGTTRCSGEAHGGCEARCLIFWKKDWLQTGEWPGAWRRRPGAGACRSRRHRQRRPRIPAGDDEIRYRCQATEILNATTPLPPYMIDQYVQDVASGNVSAANVASRVLSSAAGGVYSRLSAHRRQSVLGRRAAPPRRRSSRSLSISSGRTSSRCGPRMKSCER